MSALISEKIEDYAEFRVRMALAREANLSVRGILNLEEKLLAARASLDAALRGMLDDAERLREELAHAFLAGVEHVGGARGVSPEDALVAIEYAARAARPEASADEAQ